MSSSAVAEAGFTSVPGFGHVMQLVAWDIGAVPARCRCGVWSPPVAPVPWGLAAHAHVPQLHW
jgi:hypothetical protein